MQAGAHVREAGEWSLVLDLGGKTPTVSFTEAEAETQEACLNMAIIHFIAQQRVQQDWRLGKSF